MHTDGNPRAHTRGFLQDYLCQKGDEKGTKSIYQRKIMRKEYDFSKMKGCKNPYAKRLKKQVTIRMGVDIIEFIIFK